MKAFLTLTFLVLILSVGRSQTALPCKVKTSDKLLIPKNTSIIDLFTFNDNQTYVIRNESNDNLLIEKYDNDLKLLKIGTEEIKEKEYKYLKYSSLEYFGEKLYTFANSKSFEKKGDKASFYIQEISTDELTFKTKLIRLAQVPSDKMNPASSSFSYKFSPDKSKLIVQANHIYLNIHRPKFSFYVYDNTLEKLWSKEVELPYEGKHFEHLKTSVDNDGHVYLAGYLFEKGSKKSYKGKPNYNCIIFAFSNNGDLIKEYKFDFGENFMTTADIKLTEKNDFFCAGFFSELDEKGMKGPFIHKINKETETYQNQIFKTFDFDLLTSDLSNKKKKIAKKAYSVGKKTTFLELQGYLLRDFIPNEDGSIILIAEQERQGADTNGGAVGSIHRRVYGYKERHAIVTVKLNPNGEIAWTSKINKKQTNSSEMCSSFKSIEANDKLYLFFNDNPKNLNLEEGKDIPFYDATKTIIKIVEIDNDGNSKIHTYDINKGNNRAKNDFNLYLDKYVGINDKALIFYSMNDSYFKLLNFNFE